MIVRPLVRAIFAVLLAGAPIGHASAQPHLQPGVSSGLPIPFVVAPRLQSAAEALAQDGAEYARLTGVSLEEAIRRLRAQEESVATTDRLASSFKNRLAGISIEHLPQYRIVVLLTGPDPVPDQTVFAGGMSVPIIFRTGAVATRDQIVASIRRHQAEIRSRLPGVQGMGADPRTGEMVVLLSSRTVDLYGVETIKAELEAITAVPVRIRTLNRPDTNLAIEGGARVEGRDESGRHRACTTGFVVTDTHRTGILTAAHCPDILTFIDPLGGTSPLSFVGEWGARYQDVQIHVSPERLQPLFYADTAKSQLRRLTSWRNRASTRAGDAVCHRGETTGYSCSQVELVDFAPPGDLCGGPCEPYWVTVAGPKCRGGDSGGPVFNGTIAFGIVKGGSYDAGGACAFYYYMSTDYLPPGWSLLYR